MLATVSASPEILQRIQEALDAAIRALSPFIPGEVRVGFKQGDDPVTEADKTANLVLRGILVRDGEGWLSEESVDDLTRLRKRRVWVVDPIDGTREFVAGIPEWCVSIGLIENGNAIAGGVCNPATDETFLGAAGNGVTYNGRRARPSRRKTLSGATILASRSEVKRGEWDRFRDFPLAIRPVGSVAYKLALVAAGLADGTWTLCPKHEWDVAAGVALVKAAGGFVRQLDTSFLRFNNRRTVLPNLLAGSPFLAREMSSYLEEHRNAEMERTHRVPVVRAASREGLSS